MAFWKACFPIETVDDEVTGPLHCKVPVVVVVVIVGMGSSPPPTVTPAAIVGMTLARGIFRTATMAGTFHTEISFTMTILYIIKVEKEREKEEREKEEVRGAVEKDECDGDVGALGKERGKGGTTETTTIATISGERGCLMGSFLPLPVRPFLILDSQIVRLSPTFHL